MDSSEEPSQHALFQDFSQKTPNGSEVFQGNSAGLPP